MNTQHEIQAVLSPPAPIALSDRQAELLAWYLENQASPALLRQHHALSARELLDFLAAPAVREAIESVTRTAKAALEFVALHTRENAMSHLQVVCEELRTISNPPPETVNRLRLAATQLGRFAQTAITKPAPARRTPKADLPPASDHSPAATIPPSLANTKIPPTLGATTLGELDAAMDKHVTSLLELTPNASNRHSPAELAQEAAQLPSSAARLAQSSGLASAGTGI